MQNIQQPHLLKECYKKKNYHVMKKYRLNHNPWCLIQYLTSICVWMNIGTRLSMEEWSVIIYSETRTVCPCFRVYMIPCSTLENELKSELLSVVVINIIKPLHTKLIMASKWHVRFHTIITPQSLMLLVLLYYRQLLCHDYSAFS